MERQTILRTGVDKSPKVLFLQLFSRGNCKFGYLCLQRIKFWYFKNAHFGSFGIFNNFLKRCILKLFPSASDKEKAHGESFLIRVKPKTSLFFHFTYQIFVSCRDLEKLKVWGRQKSDELSHFAGEKTALAVHSTPVRRIVCRSKPPWVV